MYGRRKLWLRHRGRRLCGLCTGEPAVGRPVGLHCWRRAAGPGAGDPHTGGVHQTVSERLRLELPHDQSTDPDRLAGPFAHIIVDEAQELTDAEWQMLLRRCPSRSFTIVGDRAQARHGFIESWQERLERIGLDNINLASLNINYRTPEEVMAEAEPVIRAVFPEANVPISIRRTGVPVVQGSTSDLGSILDTWLATHADGIGCVIDAKGSQHDTFKATSRVRSLTPEHSKGLEFDLVILINPEAFGKGTVGTGIEGSVDRYVAMTRATQQLVILTSA